MTSVWWNCAPHPALRFHSPCSGTVLSIPFPCPPSLAAQTGRRAERSAPKEGLCVHVLRRSQHHFFLPCLVLSIFSPPAKIQTSWFPFERNTVAWLWAGSPPSGRRLFIYENHVCGEGQGGQSFTSNSDIFEIQASTEIESICYEQDLDKGWTRVIRKMGL